MLPRVLLAALALGALPIASLAASPAPVGVHLALGDDPRTSATVAWMTYTRADTFVEHGATPALGTLVQGTSAPAPGRPGTQLHEARLDGLTPGQTVYYRVGADGAWSDVHAFRTAPDGTATFRFAVFGDHGVRAQSAQTTTLVAQAAPDFALMVGDLSYANGDPAVWDVWTESIATLAVGVPLMLAPGNHEVEPGLGTSAFRARLALPGEELWYSFDYARVHFLVLHSTLEDGARSGTLAPMLAFAHADLADAAARRDAGELDFLVVAQHHPLYGNAAAIQRQYDAALVATEEPLLHRYGVDLLLAAHNHHYERSLPMAAALPVPGGFVQVITGGGGQSLYEFVDPNDVAPWSGALARRFHYVEFDVEPGVMRGRAVSTDDVPGETIDTFEVRRRS